MKIYLRKNNQTQAIKKALSLFISGISLGLVMINGSAYADEMDLQPKVEAYTHEFKLANGLRLIVREDHRSPTVAHMVWYRAGSIDEKNGTSGVAHVLEHMMFKGTESVPPGDFSKKVAALGGRENAFTSVDFTAYFQQIEKSHLKEVMALEADRMENLKLSEEEFKKEIQVVMEERRLRTEDQAQGLLYEEFMAIAFNAAPNRSPVIGWMSDLKTLTYLDARDWYQHWYKPNNAVVIIVGDVDPAQVLQYAEQSYGKVQAQALPERKSQIEPEQKGVRRFELKAPAENRDVYLGWKVPKFDPKKPYEKEPYALDVLSGILDGYPNARLNKILVHDKQLANDVGASYEPLGRGEQLFMINAELSGRRDPAQIEAEIKKILKDIATQGIREEELQRVKIAVSSAQIYKRDSVFGQAMEIGSAEMSGLSWHHIDEWAEGIQKVTAAEIKSVAQKYFIDEHLTVGVLDPLPIDAKTQAANARAAAGLLR